MARKSSRSLWTAKLTGQPLPAPGRTRPAKSPASTVSPPRGCKAIILGIDPSLRGTGLAVIDARREPMRLLASVTVKLAPKLEAYECLGKIADAVEKLARQHGVTEASIEETIYVQNFRTAQAMGASRGAALSVLARLGVTVGEYAPKRIKMAVTGHGAASKEQVGRMVRNVLSLPADLPLDESDAAAAALCHAYTARG
ncbi:MAG: crossover junction endodeoxyribonuclease RuvC [Verrucomicrobiota bacterium]|jgi:crossover junction endodeoxyribonuclease RuvC